MSHTTQSHTLLGFTERGQGHILMAFIHINLTPGNLHGHRTVHILTQRNKQIYLFNH